MKYQDLRDNFKKLNSMIMEHHERNGAIYTAVLDAFSELNVINAILCSSDLTIAISGDKQALQAAWGALRRLGFDRPGDPPKPNEPTWCGFFKNGDASIWFQFSSTVCRRVKVGTQTIEQDIYETVCGEADGTLQPVAPVLAGTSPSDMEIPF